MNIYANRVLRRDTETSRKQKGGPQLRLSAVMALGFVLSMFPTHLVTSRSSTKAAEPTQGTSTPDFPTPPPAVTDGSQLCEQVSEEYLSLKVQTHGSLTTSLYLSPSLESQFFW